MVNYFSDLQEKVGAYTKKYAKHPCKAAVKMAFWNMKYLLKLITDTQIIEKLKPEQNKTVSCCFELGGGLGDIVLALNYLVCLKQRFPNIHLTITIDKRFFNEVETILFEQDFVDELSTTKDKKQKYDVRIKLVRMPYVRYVNKTIVKKLYPEFYNFITKVENFNLENVMYNFSGSCSDFLVEKYTLLQKRKRIAEADVENYIGVTSQFEIKQSLNAENVLSKFALDGCKYITIQRGVGVCDYNQNGYSTRIWPIKHYNQLVAMLKQEYPDYKIVQVGADTCIQIDNIDLNLCGKTSFAEMLVILQNSLLHIDGECGMVHLRHFLGAKPSVVLFGPTNEKFYGYEENINMANRPCGGSCEWLHANWRDFCMFDGALPMCQQNLNPTNVFARIKEVLK